MIRFGISGVFIVIALFIGCKSDYTRMVEQELASGMIYDSLIFGMKMGQTRKDFYAVCWDLNKQKLISEGPGNLTAKYTEPEDVVKDKLYRKEMLFYGIFDEKDTMRGMDMTYYYIAWSPWDKRFAVDSLVEDLKNKYETEYPGNKFIAIDLDLPKYKAISKIDGNRQILIYPISVREVAVKIEDLRHRFKKSN